MENKAVFQFIDRAILFCLCVLVIFLPIAHTESIRAFSLGIPGGLWIIKTVLTRRLFFSRTPLDVPILFFTVVAGLSVISAVDPKYSLKEFIGEWVMGIFLFYLMVNNLRSGQMKYILGALLLGNVIMVSYGIFDFFRDGGQLFDYKVRAGSLHSGFGTFGTYLVTIIPYLLIATFSVRRTSSRIIFFFLLSLNFFCLYITHSRGSWVAVAVLLLIVGWMFLPRKVLLPALAIVVILFFYAPSKVIKHYTGITPPGQPAAKIETFQARWELTRFSVEKLKESPFRMIGFGRRSFVKKYQEFYRKYEDQFPGAQLWHAHNTFLDIALQTGLQGLVFFGLFLYKLLRYCHARATREESPLLKFYLLATFSMIITFFVRNLSDDFFVDDSALLFWFLSGAALAMKMDSERKGRAEPGLLGQNMGVHSLVGVADKN